MAIPKYRLFKSRNKGFVEFKGKRYYLPGIYNSPESIDAYTEFIQQNCTLSKATPLVENIKHGTLINTLCLAYLQWAKAEYQDHSHDSYYAQILHTAKHFGAYFADMKTLNFRAKHLKQYRKHLINTPKFNGDPPARSYVNLRISRVRMIFKWAAEYEWIPGDQYSQVVTVAKLKAERSIARETDEKEPVSWEQIQPVLEHVHHILRAMILFQWYTSARPSEIFRATPSQFKVDPREEKLLLWKPLHKTRSSNKKLMRPIGPRCQEIIKPFLDRPGDAIMFSPKDVRSDAKNTMYKCNTYYKAITIAQKRIKPTPVEIWTPYQIRHGRVTDVELDFDLDTARAIAGHKNVDTTMIYAHGDLEKAKKVALKNG